MSAERRAASPATRSTRCAGCRSPRRPALLSYARERRAARPARAERPAGSARLGRALPARPRRRRRPDGRRDRPGRRRLRPARSRSTTRSRRDRAGARGDRSAASRGSPRRAAPTRPRCSRGSRRSTSSSPAELMIEAVVEDAAVKRERLRARRRRCSPGDAVLASNTSSIPIGSLAAATGRPDARDRDALLQPGAGAALVEVVRGRGDLASETAAAIVALARELGKEPVEARDVARLRLQPDPDAVHQRGGRRARGRRRRAPRRSTPSPGSASATRWARSRSPT